MTRTSHTTNPRATAMSDKGKGVVEYIATYKGQGER